MASYEIIEIPIEPYVLPAENTAEFPLDPTKVNEPVLDMLLERNKAIHESYSSEKG